MCKVYLISEKTGGRCKKLSDELKVENLPHYAGPSTVLEVVITSELNYHQENRNLIREHFYWERKVKTITVLFCELLYMPCPVILMPVLMFQMTRIWRYGTSSVISLWHLLLSSRLEWFSSCLHCRSLDDNIDQNVSRISSALSRLD